MRFAKVLWGGLAVVLSSSNGCASISATSDRAGEVLICDGTFQQSSMFGHSSAQRRILLYPDPDPTKIRLKTFGQVEGVCIDHEGATCKTSLKGKTLVVSSTFPGWMGTQTFSFDAGTAHMTFGLGGLDGGQGFSGTCRRKDQ